MPHAEAGGPMQDEIHELLRSWRAVMASTRSPWKHADLTFTQLRALSAIARRGPLRVTELADELGIGLAAASALADRMVGRKLITRASDPNDRRIVLLEATSGGRRIVERLERGRSEHLEKLIARMTSTEREALATTLRAFVRLGIEKRDSGVVAVHLPRSGKEDD